MDDCPFCHLVRTGLPPHAIYEDERVFVMLDRQSLASGHVMVIPKTHAVKIYDMEADDYSNLLLVARELSQVLEKVLHPRAVAYVAHGAGIPHVHLHLVPLSEKDEISEPLKHMTFLPDSELAAQAARLVGLLSKEGARMAGGDWRDIP